jgi:hypothetical protein
MRTPIDALESALGRATLLDRYRHARPGRVILEMSASDRELLKQLTSEDVAKHRVWDGKGEERCWL